MSLARAWVLVFSVVAILLIIVTSATQDSVSKACTVPLNHPIVLRPRLPTLTELPMPATGLFRGQHDYVFAGKSISEEIKTKDLDEVSTLFEVAQAFAILSALAFAASPWTVRRFRFALASSLCATLFAVICGSILQQAVHKNITNDTKFHSSDNSHSLSLSAP